MELYGITAQLTNFRGLRQDGSSVDLMLGGGSGGGSGYAQEGDSPTFNIGTFTGRFSKLVPLIIQPHLSHIEGAC